MSTIKNNQATPSKSTSKVNSSKATAPKAKTQAPKESKPAEKKDGFNASKELDENKKPKDAKDSKETKDGKKPGEDKDTKKAEDGQDKDSLTQKLSELQKQLDEMKKNKPKEPENLGGCCGKSHGSKKTDDQDQKDDPDSELTKLAVALMQGGTGQQPQPGAKPGEPGAKPGEAGKAGGLKAVSSNPAQLKAELSQKYQQYKTQGVQLRKETEQLVESALNGATGSTPGNKPVDAKNTNPINKTNSNNNPQSRPLAKAS